VKSDLYVIDAVCVLHVWGEGDGGKSVHNSDMYTVHGTQQWFFSFKYCFSFSFSFTLTFAFSLSF